MRRGLQLWVWSGSLQPLCCPLSPSPLWTPQGTHALARPQEAESQDQAKGEKKGEEGRIAQKKEKSRPRLMQKYCQRVHEMQIFCSTVSNFFFFFSNSPSTFDKALWFCIIKFQSPTHVRRIKLLFVSQSPRPFLAIVWLSGGKVQPQPQRSSLSWTEQTTIVSLQVAPDAK